MTNPEFEAALGIAAHENLRKEMDAERYVQVVLDMMWDGETYRDQGGDVCYHEIGKQYTYHGRPVVVS